VQREATDAFLGSPQMAQRLSDGERARLRLPCHVLRPDQREDFTRTFSGGFLLLEEEFLKRRRHGRIIRQAIWPSSVSNILGVCAVWWQLSRAGRALILW